MPGAARETYPMRRTFLAVALASSLGLTAPACLLDSLRDFLASLGASTPSEAQTKEGCGADPNGRCLRAPQEPTKAGCGMDPSGKPNCS